MRAPGHTFAGRCHFGVIAGTLAFAAPAAETQVRSCQCSFCTRHEPLTVSDPAGSAAIDIEAGRVGLEMSYDAETPGDRVARRRQKWTPTTITFKL